MLFYPQDTGLVSACAFDFKLNHSHQVGILTMGRLTDNTGKTPSPELVAMSKNGWRHMPALAPYGQKVVDWRKGRITWTRFCASYIKKLKYDAETISAVNELIYLARDYQVIVACVEEKPDFCHRRVLLWWCKRLAPDLKITTF